MRRLAKSEKRKAVHASAELSEKKGAKKDESTTTLQALRIDGECVEPTSELQGGIEQAYFAQANAAFYSILNPRKTQNISVKEKVTKWMRNLPYQQVNGDIWITNCYPGSVSTGTETDSIDFAEVQDIQELQARKITRYVTQMYHMEDQLVRFGEEEHSLVDEQSVEYGYEDFEDHLAIPIGGYSGI